MPLLKPWRVSVNVPRALQLPVKKRVRQERYRSESAYLVGLVIKDLLARQAHRITGPLLREPVYILDEFIDRLAVELDRDEPNPLNMKASWLEGRIEEMLTEHHSEKCSKCEYRHGCSSAV